jgi:Rrf2 family iron-sulfur cluster assembly transcriptional regulator
MRITQWGEYGIHFSAYLAEKYRGDTPVVNAAEIAAEQNIAMQYAQQILLRLREGGIIESVRGPRGGYRLIRDPREITLYDVIMAAEGGTIEVICESKPLSLERCSPKTHCNLRSVWFGLRDQVDSYLKGLSLEYLLQEPESNDFPIQIGRRSHSATDVRTDDASETRTEIS